MSALSATLRAPVRLPPMPGEAAAAETCPPIAMARARLAGGRLAFLDPDGFARAARHGFFLLEIPDGLDLAPGDRFVRHFHRPAETGPLAGYTGYRDAPAPGPYEGYFDRPFDQWENFYIERRHWRMIPPDVARMGAAMAEAGIAILRAVLDRVGIPVGEFGRLTGRLTDGGGHRMLAFNHFRPDKPVRGSKFHRDSGWVTVLRSTEPGLLAWIDGALCAVDPEPGHLIVNFGSAMEVLTEATATPIRANIHGVVRTERPQAAARVSYVVFLDSDLDQDIWRWRPGGPERLQSVADFAVQEVGRTYDADDANL
jgi:hypothetical protein